MPLEIVCWIKLDCGHLVDLTRSEARSLVRHFVSISPFFTCPKCDPSVASHREIVETFDSQSNTPPIIFLGDQS